MKNNFTNFLKIICILGVIVLIIWIIYNVIVQNSPATNTNTSSKEPKEDTNISLISEELTTIFSYINGIKNSPTPACNFLSKDLGFDITISANFFDYYAPVIMDCLNNKNYPSVYYDNNSVYKIMSEDNYKEYAAYFESLKDFSKVSTIYNEEYINNLPNELKSNIKAYITNNYYLAYLFTDSNPDSTIDYTIKRIYKEKEIYKAIILASYQKHEYVGTLSISILDGHPQYSTLHFY